jgi:hypothetical protein
MLVPFIKFFSGKKAKFLVIGVLQGILLYFSEMIVDVNGYSRKISEYKQML